MRLSMLTGLTLAASVAFGPLAFADITVGVITPLTGPVAAYGEQVKTARKRPLKRSTRLAASTAKRSF